MEKVKKSIYMVIALLLAAAVLIIMIFSYEGTMTRSSFGMAGYLAITLGIIAYIVLPCFFGFFKEHPERLFLYYFTAAALAAIIFIPFGFVPDEGEHYLRAISLSQFNVFSGDAAIPDNFYDIYQVKGWQEFWGLWQIQGSADLELATAGSSIYYPPLSYLPQTLGILISGIFTDSLYVQLVVSRIFTAAAAAVIIYFAIKVIPYGKYAIISVSLLPLFIQEAASVSADGLSNAVIIADVACFLYLRKRGRLLTTRQIVIVALLVIGTFSIKPLYLVFGFIFLFLDKKCFKKKGLTLLIIYGIAAILPLAYMAVVILSGYEFSGSNAEGATMLGQLAHVLHNPLDFPIALVKTIVGYTVIYFKSAFSLLLVSFQISMKSIIVFCGCFIVIVLADYHESPGKAGRIFIIVASVVSFLLIFFMEYLQWTQVGGEIILGVQGRYFFPLLVPIISILWIPKKLAMVGENYAIQKNPVCVWVLSTACALSMFEIFTASSTLLF